MIRICLALCLAASGPMAETLVATRTIPARSIISPEDLEYRDITVVGGVSDPSTVIGQEARVALYAGRPIRAGDISAPAIIERNQIVQLIYAQGGLMITTDGRALERAAVGDWVRVMNLSSRTSVTAQIQESGVAYVTN